MSSRFPGRVIKARFYRGSALGLTLAALSLSGCQSEPPRAAPAPPVQVEAVGAGPEFVTAPASPSEPAGRVENVEPPAQIPGADPETALRLFASPVSGGWAFPSRYHYNEWRQATGLRRSKPQELTLRDGVRVKLLILRPAVPSVVILIDDLGNSSAALRAFETLPFPLNGAILPHSPLARMAEKSIRATGGDVLLHLPLEPVGYPQDDPGPGALWVTMPTMALQSVFLADWDSIPGRIGLNNHMGSRFTSNVTAMAALASAVSAKSAFFVDSRTVPHSYALTQMVAHAIPALGRTHFLDEIATEPAVEAELAATIAHAQSQGFALAIGHPNRATIKVLRDAQARFKKAGVQAIPLRELFKH